MSKRHSTLLKDHCNKCASKEEIWKDAETIWKNLDLASIALGFILAYRIAAKVIANGGANAFLQQPACLSLWCFRDDFKDTDIGVVKKIKVIE